MLSLAYLGDAVYELYIRQRLVARGPRKVGRLHVAATQFVRAQAQAAAVRLLMDTLSPAEQDIVRRGRNARTAHVPRGATLADYRHATGFEALIGYLYLTAAEERLCEVLDAAWKHTVTNREE